MSSSLEKQFRNWLSSHRRPETVRNRAHYARKIIDWAEDHQIEVFELDTRSLAQWLLTVGKSPSTRKNAADAARVFFSWARVCGYVEANPTDDLPKITVPRGLPKPAPDLVLERAIDRAKRPIDLLMLLLASYGGLRVSEIAPLHSSDVFASSVRIVGKGGHVRHLPLHPIMNEPLKERPEGFIFPSTRNPTGHYLPGSIAQRIHNLLDSGWSAHTLRHRFATEYYRNNPDLLALRDLLGHADVSTTMIYTRVNSEHLAAEVADLAPVGDVQGKWRELIGA